jgi:release factor glutamine methyltransferase
MTATLAAPILSSVLDRGAARLRKAGIGDARRDARLLLAHAIGAGLEIVIGFPERPISAAELASYESLIARRARREPVSRILEQREFWSLLFRLTADTFDPRPDSETLVEAILERVVDRSAPLRILDLGTGTGCLLLALLSALPRASGLGIDISAQAVTVARANAEALGLSARAGFRCADWGSGAEGFWQVIVSNPPYIVEGALPRLPPEVALYDPPTALLGNADGLGAYRALVPHAARLLAPGGVIAVEVGRGQAASVESILAKAGLKCLERRRDLSGIDRCILATG